LVKQGSKIENKDDLLLNTLFDEDARAREICLDLLEYALEVVNPIKAVKSTVSLQDTVLRINDYSLDLSSINRIFIVGAGKASGGMAEALEAILKDKITAGTVNIPENTKQNYRTEKIELREAGHPLPNSKGLKGAREISALLSTVRDGDLVFCLISGGGSALLPMPAGEINLQEKMELTKSLLLSGATINEINAVRKHVSDIKGGRLANRAYPATVISLIISDVVDDHLDIIASGPTVPDSSTYRDAIEALQTHKLWKDCPQTIKEHLKKGVKGIIDETPKPNNPIFSNVHNFLIANNQKALEAINQAAKKQHFNPILLSSSIEGEASEIGEYLAGYAKKVIKKGETVKKPCVVIVGGETTVTVTGKGLGGRNQEAMLSAARYIGGLKGVAIVSIGTDGIDGVTEAAGAIINGRTLSKAQERELRIEDYLKNNDSYHFFKSLNDLVITGSTGTNVNDVMLIVVV